MQRDLYASGLGLMISSRDSLRGLREGVNYLQTDEEEGAFTRLLDDQEIVMLGTGSPQLDYQIHVYAGPIPPAEAVKVRGVVETGLRIRGGVLVFRDGYDLLDWKSGEDQEASFEVPDGYYRMRIGWEPAARHSMMILHVGFELSTKRVPGDGSLELLYSFDRSNAS